MPEAIVIPNLIGPTEFYSSGFLTDSALKGYWRGEDLNDSSGNGKTLTKVGTVANNAAKFNNGFDANFTDVTNNLTNTSVYAPGTGDVTLGCWFKKNGAPSNDFTPTILSLGNSGGSNRVTLEATKTNGYASSEFVNSGANAATSSKNICDNAFHFLVVTRSGTAVTLYVDAIVVATTTSSKNITDDDILFGYAGASSGFDSIGQSIIDDAFVMSRALTAAEVSQIYGALAYWKLEDVNDSKNSNNLTNNGTVTFSAAKFNNGANLGSSNSSKYLDIASSIDITTGVCSFGGWFKGLTEIGSGTNMFLQHSHSTGGGNDDLMNVIQYDYNSGTRRLNFGRYTNAWEQVFYTIALGTDDFYHLFYVYTGSKVRGYVNGVQVGEADATSTTYTHNSGVGFRLGADKTSGGVASQYSSVIIDDVVLFNRALTATEVSQIYGLATTNYLKFYRRTRFPGSITGI